MNKYFIVPGTDNVIDIKKYRTYAEMHKLMASYKKRVSSFGKDQISAELVKLKEEVVKYPNHLLTNVKVQIFENATQTKV